MRTFLGPPTDDDWATAIKKAQTLVKTLTIEEQVSLATGIGWEKGKIG